MIQQIKYYEELEEFKSSSLLSHQVLHINLRLNSIDDEGVSGLGSALVNCINLSNLTLYLGYNYIGDRIEQKYSHIQMHSEYNLKLIFIMFIYLFIQLSYQWYALARLLRLTRLYRLARFLESFFQIGAIGASGLGSSLANCINLSNLTLELRYNQIGDEGASGLGSALANCINLQNLTLDLQSNQIGDRIEQNTRTQICTQNTSQTISFIIVIYQMCLYFYFLTYSEQIGDEGASGLGSSLANCINLSNLNLDLQSNQIGDEGASGLGCALANCINLSNLTLDLESNQIGDEGASGLGSALANCINLSNLTLYLGSMNESQELKVKSKCLKSKRLVVFDFQ
ncbi:cyclic nucleotide-binding domain protein, putative (macronuclear) [Tetrahymena thermophila SB210]|uniref:Cyclic nucleotide-binding domain protein, putative n=1 Tax=Tetrahymena thermophila (strain SB210) TaxID=312017 RepID=Q22A42_TETTS|nr:cyclic nucleotide-binding domain protein, putative [Tetrahymena thermophila SB210]EAR82138.3 cyclic nucleotide-binding domain protein, putative [Tetrahymena thermophila SB210]|eukprot:XP_001029801.3 cyclic nucleotide-binding domain protein, putative [Tetrahymena thermophila SB210]